MKITDIMSPDDIKNMSIDNLNKLCDDIRTFLIGSLSKTGGHMSSNLGIVELTVALHYVFNSPKDKLIFDVGHQSYVHKILTGRSKDFDKLRKKDGLSGFIKYNESAHDVWEAGHSSTSLSAVCGFLEAKASGEDIGEVIGVIGDGSITNGLAFEALNYLGSQKNQKAIIILNDNDMSISQNVGRLAKSMSKIRIKKSYSLLKKITPHFIHRHFKNLKTAIRSYVYNPSIFSALGYKYYGPIDGHNLKELIKYLEFAKSSPTTVILHVKTVKGKGYEYSENDKVGSWHGVGPFDIVTGEALNKPKPGTIAWGAGICNLLIQKANEKMRIITPAMISGSNLINFQKTYPQYLIDVGIAEEHAVVMAAAMSRNNLIPIVSIYSTFMQRAYDQISHDVCRNNNHVIFLVDRAGINGGDGSTHQGIFDISFLSHLPNMVITMPRNLSEANILMDLAIKHQGPFVIRYPKANTIDEYDRVEPFAFGTWEEVLPINEKNIITYGDEVNKYELALQNKNIGLINARFIKPIDKNMLEKLKDKTVYIVEEVIRNGSLGSLILEHNNRYNLNINIKTFAIDDIYLDSGSIEELRKDLQLDVESILKKI